MPLKPIFDKSPLMKLSSVPLQPGQARTALEEPNFLYRLPQFRQLAKDRPAMWEGLFRLACIIGGKAEESPAAEWILSALEEQAPDGSLPGTPAENVAVLRAAWAMYEYDPRHALLEKLALWCGWACEHWEQVVADRNVRVRPADLMELLCAFYRVTGMKAVLSLCERLRVEGMDWSGVLRTFALQQPMRRMMSFEELQQKMEQEDFSESGFYTRQYLTCHAPTLADGMRAAMACGRYSGSATELSAAKTGWERISRYHGAVCGGTTAEETLGGLSPDCAVSTAALGAWAEAFARADEAWAYEALELLLRNALPAAMDKETGVASFRYVNTLGGSEVSGGYDCREDALLQGYDRLCRAYAAAVSCAVTVRPDGAQANLFLPGKYSAANEKMRMLLTISGKDDCRLVHVHVKENTRAVLRLRIPSWAQETTVYVNGQVVDADCENLCVVLNRTWSDGDEVKVELMRGLQVLDGYHQSACVMWGGDVMAYVPENDLWNVAVCGDPEINDQGEVTLPVCTAPDWKKNGSVPKDLPVQPRTEGEVFHAVLRPYARCDARIALLPRGKRA